MTLHRSYQLTDREVEFITGLLSDAPLEIYGEADRECARTLVSRFKNIECVRTCIASIIKRLNKTS